MNEDEIVEKYLIPPEPDIIDNNYIINSLSKGVIRNTDYHSAKLVYWFLKNDYKTELHVNTYKWYKKIDNSWILMKNDLEIKRILSEKLAPLIYIAKNKRREELRNEGYNELINSDVIIKILLTLENNFYNTSFKSRVLRDSLHLFFNKIDM
jgi:hypothetical protein